MELKPGQKVRLKSLDECEENSRAIVDPMFPFFGSVVTIEEVRNHRVFTIREDGHHLLYVKSWIDSASILPEHLFTIEE